MATPVLMPKQGNSVEECLIVAWKKKVGESVKQGEALAEMETDKATFELEAPADGTVLALFVNEGELAPVLTNVGVIGKAGEDVEAFRPKKKTAAAPKAAGAPVAAAGAAAPVVSVAAAGGAAAVATAPAAPVVETLVGVASPRAQELARKYGVEYSRLSGSGPNGRVVEADIRKLYHSSPRRSFLARKLLTEGYELGKGDGSGVNGLIRGCDLKKGQPLSNVRKVIAQRMSASLKEHAQLTLNASACAEKLLACRAVLKNDKSRPGVSGITIGDLIMLAVIDALKKMPEINCEYTGGKVYPGKGVNIAFACDTPKGLLVPVVHGADKLSLLDISLKVKQLAGEAQAGNISPDNLEGGTFTVSNLGSFGIESFTPVLNAPQVAILGVCAPVLRPVRVGAEVKFKDFIGFSLTIDHQVIDGAPGAKFLQQLKTNIESVDQLAGIQL